MSNTNATTEQLLAYAAKGGQITYAEPIVALLGFHIMDQLYTGTKSRAEARAIARDNLRAYQDQGYVVQRAVVRADVYAPVVCQSTSGKRS